MSDAGRPTSDAVEIGERRMHPGYLLIAAGQTLRGLLPVLLGVGFLVRHWWLLIVAGVLIVALSGARWWTTTYAVEAGSLRYRSGLVNRGVHTVPLHRITALEAHRGLVNRVFGLWSVRIQTPGASERDGLRLHCLNGDALAALQRAADPTAGRSAVAAAAVGGHPASGTQLGATAVPPPAEESGPGGATAGATGGATGGATDTAGTPVNLGDRRRPVLIARLGSSDLLLAAVTGTSIPLMIAGIGVAWSRLHDWLPERTFASVMHAVFGNRSAAPLIIAGLLVVAVLVAITLTSLRLAAFTVSREGTKLRVTRGMISQRSGTIAIDRIQAIRVVEGIGRLAIGRCAVEVEVAGLHGAGQDSNRLLFPLLRVTEVADFVRRAVPGFPWPTAPLATPPTRARRRFYTRPVLIGAAISVLLWWVSRDGWVALVPLPLLAAVALGHGRSRATGWQVDEHTTTSAGCG